MNTPQFHALLDIDDTLGPWEKPHAKAYPAMSKALSQASGIGHSQIIDEIRAVNTRHRTIEYTALIQNMASFKDLPNDELEKFIKIAQKSRYEAMDGQMNPFDGVIPMLITFQINQIARLALSDAPKHLAYLRLKRLELLKELDQLIALPSPQDNLFSPQHRMGNKPFLLPIIESPVHKPNTDLITMFNCSPKELSQQYFIIGNSDFSDMGLGRRNGLLSYNSHWDKGTPEDRSILAEYVDLDALKHNVGTSTHNNFPTHPNFEKVDVYHPNDIITDLRKRGIITK